MIIFPNAPIQGHEVVFQYVVQEESQFAHSFVNIYVSLHLRYQYQVGDEQ